MFHDEKLLFLKKNLRDFESKRKEKKKQHILNKIINFVASSLRQQKKNCMKLEPSCRTFAVFQMKLINPPSFEIYNFFFLSSQLKNNFVRFLKYQRVTN